MSTQSTSFHGSSRRDFLKKTTLGAAGLAVASSARSYAATSGANDKVRVAVIGLKRRGIPLSHALSRVPNAELACVCEVDSKQLGVGMEAISKNLDRVPEVEKDIRRVVERKDIDAVILAIPDHWHAYGTLIALQNGKHVYVEKPCSHNLAEDDFLILAEQRYPDLKIQMGSQQRSAPESIEIVKAIHDGVIGEAYRAVAFYTNNRGRVPNPKVVNPPKYLDWDLWQGPAPRRPYMDIIGDYNWHWYWHWGTAESANNGTHELDIGRWALQGTFPEQITTESGKFHYKDDGWTMYDTMYATFRYPGNKILTWDGNSRNGYSTYGSGRGTIIYGTEGSVYVDRGGYRLYDRDGALVREASGASEAGTALGGGGGLTDRHMYNFIESIRGNETLRVPMSEGAVSTHLTHYINVASRAGDARLSIDPETGHFTDRKVMEMYWGRDYEPGWELKL